MRFGRAQQINTHTYYYYLAQSTLRLKSKALREPFLLNTAYRYFDTYQVLRTYYVPVRTVQYIRYSTTTTLVQDGLQGHVSDLFGG